MTALASAVGGAVAWIAFCIMAGLARLGTADLANAHISANDPEYSLSGRLQEASATLHQASRQVFVPTFVVADASGLVNAALPLAITVTNYTSDTNIHLSGLVVGTTLSSGATAGDGQWRVAIDDLPKTRVIPPPEYVGEMTILAELRGGDDQGIVRTPVRLTWRPAAADSTEAMEPHRSVPLPSVADNVEPKQVLFEQFLAWQNEPTVAQPRQLKPGKNMSGTIKASKFKKQNLAKRQRHRIMSVRSELQTNIDPRQELRPPPTYNSFANVYAPRESNPLWNDDSQTTFDANWRRCGRLFGC